MPLEAWICLSGCDGWGLGRWVLFRQSKQCTQTTTWIRTEQWKEDSPPRGTQRSVIMHGKHRTEWGFLSDLAGTWQLVPKFCWLSDRQIGASEVVSGKWEEIARLPWQGMESWRGCCPNDRSQQHPAWTRPAEKHGKDARGVTERN